jgi:hypothetical protein
MSFPLPFNATCDIYRNGNGPPSPPDVVGVSGNLVGRGVNLKPIDPYTHWIDVPLATDIRAWSPGPDTIYVPDMTGTPFLVVKVVRVRTGSGNDYKRVYLNRQAPTWPTDQL